ncbi:MAG: tetraacyldisaccharide 4'-kinase [Woeseiaceae bacterium]
MSRAEDSWVAKTWYGDSPLVWILVPFSWLYAAIIRGRKSLYRRKVLPSHSVGVPVVVVGNITVGGTGKTPLTIWLAGKLHACGFSPGIISRGYRGSVGAEPMEATPQSDPAVVGDEAVLLASHSDCHVVVHPDRVAAATRAIELGADVIIADDGLQHYRLARDVEIAVIDGHRGFGNGRLLPAGPLREKPGRLESVDKVVVQRRLARPDNVLRRASDRRPLHFSLKPVAIRRLDDSEVTALADFAGRKVHALAGIGNPERFFRMLESFGMIVKRHPLPDHAKISPADVTFDDGAPVIMTSKDAVKCRFAEAQQCWSVEVDVVFEGEEGDMLLDLVRRNIEALETAS